MVNLTNLTPPAWQAGAGRREIYLDNAATTWPKPPVVVEAMSRFWEEAGGNPGRASHRRAVAAAAAVLAAREGLARLLGASDPDRIIFTLNATDALNMALKGLLRAGDRVVTTSMEHNAVLRPLHALAQEGVLVEIVPCSPDGTLDLDALASALHRPARLVVLHHVSNVTGTIAPIAAAAGLAHAAGALLLVDAAQSAGSLPFSLEESGADLVAFTGHKGLLGPPGTGGLWLQAGVDMKPWREGGTGSLSEEETQPPFLPDRYEAGTPNTVGLAGLAAAVAWLEEKTVAAIAAQEAVLTRLLLEGLAEIPGVTVYGPPPGTPRGAIVSFTLAGRDSAEVVYHLEQRFGIMARCGLHCAPRAHKTIGTFPAGTIRFSPGPFTTEEEITAAIKAVAELARK